MHRNYWEVEDDYTDFGPPLDDDTPDPPVRPIRESVSGETLKRRLDEALSLLRAIRRQESVQR